MRSSLSIYAIGALMTGGILLRPFGLSEAVWAGLGVLLLLLLGLLPWSEVVAEVARGWDVYLFLVGMLLLAEIAREEGVFEWLSVHAGKAARGSAKRLFTLVYAVSVLVTVFLSNDATAVVLTPAVLAVARALRVERPLPHLLACAFVANAASFALPISNPANLVIYQSRLPSLGSWLSQYGLASVLALLSTYVCLYAAQRGALSGSIAVLQDAGPLRAGGRAASVGLVFSACALVLGSVQGGRLGPIAALAAAFTLGVVCAAQRTLPLRHLKGVAWGVLPLVASLFVWVAALRRAGLLGALASLLQELSARSPAAAPWASAGFTAIACNLFNNLPTGMLAAETLAEARASGALRRAVLIAVDLAPNLSVTGSLATLLWLGALRREGIVVRARDFFWWGLWVTPPALGAALLAAD